MDFISVSWIFNICLENTRVATRVKAATGRSIVVDRVAKQAVLQNTLVIVLQNTTC